MAPFAEFIIIEDNSQKLANKIEHYLNYRNEVEEKVNNGFEWVKDKNWDTMVNVYLKLWGI